MILNASHRGRMEKTVISALYEAPKDALDRSPTFSSSRFAVYTCTERCMSRYWRSASCRIWGTLGKKLMLWWCTQWLLQAGWERMDLSTAGVVRLKGLGKDFRGRLFCICRYWFCVSWKPLYLFLLIWMNQNTPMSCLMNQSACPRINKYKKWGLCKKRVVRSMIPAQTKRV